MCDGLVVLGRSFGALKIFFCTDPKEQTQPLWISYFDSDSKFPGPLVPGSCQHFFWLTELEVTRIKKNQSSGNFQLSVKDLDGSLPK